MLKCIVGESGTRNKQNNIIAVLNVVHERVLELMFNVVKCNLGPIICSMLSVHVNVNWNIKV